MNRDIMFEEALRYAKEVCHREQISQDVTEVFIQELAYADPEEFYSRDYLGTAQMVREFADWYEDNRELMAQVVTEIPKCKTGCTRKSLVYLGTEVINGKKYRTYRCRICDREQRVKVL